MYMRITFTDGTIERVYCSDGSYRLHDGVLSVCENRYTNERVNYPLAGIRKYELEN